MFKDSTVYSFKRGLVEEQRFLKIQSGEAERMQPGVLFQGRNRIRNRVRNSTTNSKLVMVIIGLNGIQAGKTLNQAKQ